MSSLDNIYLIPQPYFYSYEPVFIVHNLVMLSLSSMGVGLRHKVGPLGQGNKYHFYIRSLHTIYTGDAVMLNKIKNHKIGIV